MYESKAECRFLRSLGGDAVGMSTIPEVVAAHHCNMKALCLSLMTNQVVMDANSASPVATHAEVLEAVEKRSQQMQDLVRQIVIELQQQVLPKLPPLRSVTLDLKASVKRDYFRTQSTDTGSMEFAMTDDEYEEPPPKHVSVATHVLLGAGIFAVGALFGAWSAKRR